LTFLAITLVVVGRSEFQKRVIGSSPAIKIYKVIQ
jgi:hypothetical protein